MKKIIFLLLLTFSLNAETANDETFVCFNADSLARFAEFIIDDKIDSARELIESGECAKLDKGTKFKVLAKHDILQIVNIAGIRAYMVKAR